MLPEAALYLVIGTVAGFASGLPGIGAGVMIVPAMVALGSLGGADPAHVLKAAVATSSLVVFANSLPAYAGYARRAVACTPGPRSC